MTEIRKNPETSEQWRGYWEGILDKGGNPFLCPGADDTKRRLVWTSGKNETEPFVLFSESPSLDDAKRIKARRVLLPNSVVDANHAEFSELLPNRTYYYRCVTNETQSDIYSFSTKEKSDVFSCIYVADVHVGSSNDNPDVLIETSFRLHKVFLEALSHRPSISMILSGGDQASSGKSEEYRGFAASPVLSKIPVNCIIGNHDKKNFVYTYFFNNPNYKIDGSHSFMGSNHWFTHNNVLFVCIDSNNPCLNNHIKTFRAAFAENPNCKWKIVMIHHDLYGGHNKNRTRENNLLARLLVPLIDKYGIDLVTGGHNHYYSRSHILYNRKVSQNTDGLKEIVNPKGTVFLASGSVNSPRRGKERYTKGEECAIDHISETDRIYNILDFQGDRLTINSYVFNQKEPFEKFSIIKKGNDGAHKKSRFPFYYILWRPITLFYGIINNKIEIKRLNKKGIFNEK